MLLVKIRISVFVEVTADGRLWLGALRPNDCIQSMIIRADIGKASEKVHRARAEAE